ncbi:HAD family hydrolase [Streptomyces sp. YGL11-2]|uniref:HAD family hydrolase n=1 Tax=Streptomyces sp. YGL11-2 TaxID=3414028 RepID=UPI003CE8AE5D
MNAPALDDSTSGEYIGPPAPRLVATDLDGTLLRPDATVSPRTRATLARAVARGIHHVIVTGRPAAGCASFFEALGYTGLAVCGQGAQIYDVGRSLLLSSVPLDRAAARTVVSRLETVTGPVDIAAVTSGTGAEFVVTTGFARGDERELAPFRPVTRRQLWELPLDKILLRHRALTDTELTEAALRCVGPGLTVTHAGPRMVELLPTGFDKATGLARVAESLGVGAQDVIAFGDMPNDIPMLRWAGHAVAMTNAHPSLKAVTQEIAPDNHNDGVAAVLERILHQCAEPVSGRLERISDQGAFL